MTRQERVEELIRGEVCDILRDRVSDPRIGFVSITAVEISSDLENATIYVSVFGDENKKKEALAGLASATNFIRGELGERLELRLTPKIHFERDDSLERGSKVLGIMRKLENEERVRKSPGTRKKR